MISRRIREEVREERDGSTENDKGLRKGETHFNVDGATIRQPLKGIKERAIIQQNIEGAERNREEKRYTLGKW